MEPIIEVLPEGWREKARELNAFRRAGDYLKTPEGLLRVLLLWADLGTFGHTAAFLRTSGDFPMSKAALYQRVAKSEEWLESDTFFQDPEKLCDACSDSERKRTLTLVAFSLQIAFT